MSRPSRSRAGRAKPKARPWLRKTHLAAAAGLAAAGWAVFALVGYIYEAPRIEIRNIRVLGLERLTERDILGRIGYAPGTNMLRVDLDETRAAVESILWVRNASVRRVWPDEIVIAVVERRPIALARVEGEIFQVDAEGVILAPDVAAGAVAGFPILDGLRPDDLAGNVAKIDAYHRVVEVIGEAELSEVHVTDAGDVSVVPNNSPLVVDLGASEHADRWGLYLRLRRRIQDEYPLASRVDLRFRDQIIIQTRGSQAGGSIVWGEEKKLL